MHAGGAEVVQAGHGRADRVAGAPHVVLGRRGDLEGRLARHVAGDGAAMRDRVALRLDAAVLAREAVRVEAAVTGGRGYSLRSPTARRLRGDPPVQALVAIAAVWPVALSTAAGVRGLPDDWLLAARALGASRAEVVRTVVLPGVRPAVLTGVRLALGVAWIVLVPAEMLGVSSGLGYEVLNARDNLAYDELMAVILAIGMLGFPLDLLAQVALRRRCGAARPPAAPCGRRWRRPSARGRHPERGER